MAHKNQVHKNEPHTVFHHNSQELDDDFRRRSDEHLALASLLCVVDHLQGIVQYVHSHHGDEVLLC